MVFIKVIGIPLFVYINLLLILSPADSQDIGQLLNRIFLYLHLFLLICANVKCRMFRNKKFPKKRRNLCKSLERRPIASRTSESFKACQRKGPNSKPPEALLMIVGNKLILTCQICLPPYATSLGVWKRLLPDTATFAPVHFDGQRSRLQSDLSLEISNIREEDSGIYFCSLGPEVMAKYAVDVVQLEPHRYIIMGGKKKKNGPSEDTPLNDMNLVLGMTWSEWSQCNRCDSVGRRRRVGICTVRKIDPFAPSKPIDTQILNEYKKGIPCRSSLLPKVIKDLAVVHSLKSEFMIGFCKIPCRSGAGIVVVTDKNGAVLDTVDNSQGVYSMHQPLPKLPALVKRSTVYEEVGKSVILSCPGNKENSFLIWRNDSYVINPSKVHMLTKGRVKIDLGNNLHIRQLRYTDAAIYSCWDNSALVGTIRLQVLEKSIQRSYRIHILNIGALFTFCTIFMVALTVCKNRGLTKD